MRSAGAAFVNGAVSTGYLKNPTNPKYRRDSAVRQYNRLMVEYGPSDCNSNDTFYYYGFAKGYDVVKLLYAAGKNPTRASLMAATQKMNWFNPYMIKGVQSKTTEERQLPARPGEDRPLQRRLLERGLATSSRAGRERRWGPAPAGPHFSSWTSHSPPSRS